MDSPDRDRLQSALWTSYVEDGFVKDLRRFVAERIEPEADRIDREDVYPVEIVKELAARGYNTLTLEPDFGGKGYDFSFAACAMEEISAASAATGICLITIYQAQTMIRLFGQDSLRQKYLPLFSARTHQRLCADGIEPRQRHYATRHQGAARQR